MDNKLKYLAFIFTLLLLLCKSLVASAQPNIVFILVDDWGYGDASSKLSGVPLPGIDAIAKAGITFTNGYVTASVCAPSRTGAFLGFSSQRIGSTTTRLICRLTGRRALACRPV